MTAAFRTVTVTLENIERLSRGAAVRRVSDLTYSICREVLDEMHLVAEGKVCSTILKLYNEDAIVVEPAGALSIAALDDFAGEIKGKTVVCIVSGSNNDIDRMQEIKERSLQYEVSNTISSSPSPNAPAPLENSSIMSSDPTTISPASNTCRNTTRKPDPPSSASSCPPGKIIRNC